MSKSKSRRPQGAGRPLFLLGTVVFLLSLVAIRLVWIQIVAAPAYAERAMAQRLRDVELSPKRGTIYDREGEPLAVSVEAKTVYAAPNEIADRSAVATAMAETLGGDAASYLAKLEKGGGFVYIERKADLERANALKALKIKGVGFIDDSKRMYPSGELACQVLGFVGVEDKGLAGLEAEYEKVLGGRPGVLLQERDPSERPIPGGVQKRIEPVDGDDIVLTIDKDIQYQAQLEIGKAVETWGAKSGSAIVMNPRNGEILAMATAPGFNPNQYGKAEAESIRNKPLTDAYEPGSTIKALTTAAVIEEGLYTPDSMFSLPPTIKIGGRTIHESHGRAAVEWSLTDILTNSSNVGTVKLGLKLGEKGLYDSFAAFGLTETPGTDFPGTTKGWLPPVKQWSASSIGNIPFGQGVSVTPIQLARAIAAIANGGRLTTPHLLLDVPDDRTIVPEWQSRSAISSDTAGQVTEMLAKVVTEGTGKAAAVPGYTVAGKTGTAQKALSGGRGYAGGKYVASFIGYLPAEDPQVLVFVLLDEPTRGIYGGAVAAPTFSALGQFAVSHLKVPPSSAYRRSEEATGAAGKKGAGAGVGQVSDDRVTD